MVYNGADVSIGTLSEEDGMKGHQISISKSRDQKPTLSLRTDQSNRLRGTIDDNLIGR